jgi:hypothetical protein
VPRSQAGGFIAERNAAPDANCRSTPMAAGFPTCIPACIAGISGETARDGQHRPGADPDCKISVCHGISDMFAISKTIIMSHQPP